LPNQFSFTEKIYFLTITQIPSIPGIYNNLTGQKMYNKKMLLTQHPGFLRPVWRRPRGGRDPVTY